MSKTVSTFDFHIQEAPMSNQRPRKRRRFRIHPVIKFLFSIAAICLMLYLAGFAFRYCLGLFIADEDYLVQLPGQPSPIAEVVPEKETVPAESDAITVVGRATVMTAGDLMTHMPIVNSGKTSNGYDFSYIYQYIGPYVSAADYAVVNLETTLAGSDKEYTGYPKFNAPDAIATGAAAGGFDMMTVANNHCYDYGTSGMLRTLEVVRDANLDTLGVNASADETKYVVKDLNGIKVGMINYTYGEIDADRNTPAINGLPTDNKAAGLINAFDYDNLDMFYAEMENHISAMKAAGAEAIVLIIHWGEEFTVKPNSNQRAIAQKMCELGVDVIAGGHPHAVQPMELLTSSDGSRQTLCLYSMGNLVSNQRSTNISMTSGHSEDSVIFSFTFVKYSNGEVHLESTDLIPNWMLIRGKDNSRTYHILPLDESVADWKSAYDLSGTQLSEAQASLQRTKELVSSSLTAIRSTLDQQSSIRNQNFGIFTGGVG